MKKQVRVNAIALSPPSTITTLLLASGLLPAAPEWASAQFTFSRNNTALTVLGWTGTAPAANIPATFNGKPVVAIGNGAFRGNSRLTIVSIPDSVTNIDDFAFSDCASLTAIHVDPLNGSFSSLEGVLFDKAQSRLIQWPGGKSGAYTIPNGIISIWYNAFLDCSGLTSVTIPNSVTSIEGSAFSGCSGLTNVTIPNSITSIRSEAFAYCTNLTSVSIPDNVTSIEDSAFSGCSGLTSVTIPNSVTDIGRYAFADCHSLTDVAFPTRVTSIAESTFSGCYALTSMIIPDSVTSVGNAAFYGSGLTSMVIPDSVGSIGWWAFAEAADLTSVFIGKGVTNIDIDGADSWHPMIFTGCNSLTNLSVDPLNPVFSSLDGVLLNKAQDKLLICPVGKRGPYQVPDGVTDLADYAFSDCHALTAVTIPCSVTNIEVGAFSYCDGLSDVSIPGSVANIGLGVFFSCSRLQYAFFLGDAPDIGGSSAFGGCTNVCYYLPGTTGWGSSIGGVPAVLWNPKIQVGSASAVRHTNAFDFNIVGTSDIPYVLEAASNVTTGPWTALQTGSLTNGLVSFSDPERKNYPNRFYRIRSP
jgi:hypothetical protein